MLAHGRVPTRRTRGGRRRRRRHQANSNPLHRPVRLSSTNRGSRYGPRLGPRPGQRMAHQQRPPTTWATACSPNQGNPLAPDITRASADSDRASGPTTAQIPPQAVHDPIAPPRRSCGPNAATMIASELGVASAPAAHARRPAPRYRAPERTQASMPRRQRCWGRQPPPRSCSIAGSATFTIAPSTAPSQGSRRAASAGHTASCRQAAR